VAREISMLMAEEAWIGFLQMMCYRFLQRVDGFAALSRVSMQEGTLASVIGMPSIRFCYNVLEIVRSLTY
jgi:hypothetical protein